MKKILCKQIYIQLLGNGLRDTKNCTLVETMPTGTPTNPYGWTKLMMEQILSDTAKANPDMSIVILRYFNPIGAPRERQNRRGPKRHPQQPYAVHNPGRRGKTEMSSEFRKRLRHSRRTGVRDYIHVVDLAKGHVKAIDYSATHKGTEIFNLGTGTGYSVLDIV